MSQSNALTSTARVCLFLLLGVVLTIETPARSERSGSLRPDTTRIVRADTTSAVPATYGSIAETGIRSYGTDGIRVSNVAGGTIVSDGTPSQRPTRRGTGVGLVRKISGASMAGGVTAFAVSPDGQRAVYIADQNSAGRFELFSTPLDQTTSPTNLTAGLTFGAGDVGVSAFQISPDGTTVAFLADVNSGGGVDDLYTVPIDSSSPTQMSAGGAAPVTEFGFTPDSAKVAFFGIDTQFASGGVELYVGSTGGSSATQISDASDVNAAGNVIAADFSPDSSTMVYAADAASDEVFQWFSVATSAGAPGSDVQLSSAMGSVQLVAISPDSGTVVYTGDDTSPGVVELFAVPIGGGGAIKLNPSMAGNVREIQISPDGSRVGYLADQTSPGVVEVHSAQIGSAGSGVRLNTPMAGAQTAMTLNIGPDSATVLYEADQDTVGTFELFGVPIDASTGPTTLQPLVAPDNVGFFTGAGTPIIGRRAVYPVFSTAVELYSVPFDGSAASVRLNDALAAGDTVFSGFVPVDATRLMAYGIGASAGNVTEIVEVVPIRGDLATEQMNVTAGAGALGVAAYAVDPTERYGVYIQDQGTNGTLELYSRELDSDADSVINAGDNCPFVSNIGQGAVVLGQTVSAASATVFGWGTRTEVRWVRGPLDMVGSYAVDDSGVLLDATSHTDSTSPGAGSGLYYLYAPDCAGRSYQTTLGVEPGRDGAGLP